MIGLRLTLLSSSALLSLRPPASLASKSYLKPSQYPHFPFHPRIKPLNNSGLCRAEFSQDAPIAAAIGGCLIASLLFPATETTQEEGNENDSAIDSGDTRLTVMGIISVIRYFNWLARLSFSWVFAWLDMGKRHYAVYANVYLAPNLWHNFSLAPEESWLPIASINLCIIHVQLETSIRNGNLQYFQVFNDVAKHVLPTTRKEDLQSKAHSKMRRGEEKNLPSSEDEFREEIRQRKAKRHSEHQKEFNGGWDQPDDDGEEKLEH